MIPLGGGLFRFPWLSLWGIFAGNRANAQANDAQSLVVSIEASERLSEALTHTIETIRADRNKMIDYFVGFCIFLVGVMQEDRADECIPCFCTESLPTARVATRRLMVVFAQWHRQANLLM